MNTHEVPLRERVRAQLLELISEMDLTVNTRLLSEGQLAAKFQVSRSTIRTVLSDLEVEGQGHPPAGERYLCQFTGHPGEYNAVSSDRLAGNCC